LKRFIGNRRRYQLQPADHPEGQLHMSYEHHALLALIVGTLFLVGCNDRNVAPGPASSASSVGERVDALTDKWIGQWNGPEGTFLRLAGGQGKYEITIQNLDGPRTFQGSTAGGQIQFERDGLKESIRATDGAETGMKWLSGKSNCLTVRAGEGYCRD
jgi:hypothetical protein